MTSQPDNSTSTTGRPLHHIAIIPNDIDTSLRFYRDGLGLEVLADVPFGGEWKRLFDAPSDQIRSIFLGSTSHGISGIVELVSFSDTPVSHEFQFPKRELQHGFMLMSFYVDDVNDTLERLAALGLADDPRQTRFGDGPSALNVASVRDPDGGLVELLDNSPIDLGPLPKAPLD